MGTTAEGALIRFVQRHERALIVGWLAFCAASIAVLGAWGVALGGAERAVEAWDARWIAELDRIEADVRAGRHAEAAEALERLDADQPALFVKHRHDRQRERLLGLLAECDVALDRRGKAREALAKLVAFDPKNFDNPYRLARAEHGFADFAAAKKAYDEVLAIHPTHWPSVEARLDIPFDAGVYAEVVEVYERYLEAWLLAPIVVRAGDVSAELEAFVDGRARAVEGILALPAGWSGPLEVETGGFSAQVDAIELVAPLKSGVVSLPAVVRIVPDGAWTVAGGSSSAPGALQASEAGSKLVTDAVTLPGGAARVRIELALFKRLSPEAWEQVTKSYRNRLDAEGLREATERSRVGGCDEGGTTFRD
jgi:tetratricopeptide (TPR) repeat protein